MIYKISDVIEALNKLKNTGREYLSEKELLMSITPKINRIDDYISMFENLKQEKDTIHGLSRSLDGKISRQTLHRWKNKGILITHIHEYEARRYKKDTDLHISKVELIYIDELIKNLKAIKEIHSKT